MNRQFSELIESIDRKAPLREGERSYFVSPDDVRTSRPLVRRHDWKRYRLLLNDRGSLDIVLQFKEHAVNKDFKVRVVSELTLINDDDKLRQIARWENDEGGLNYHLQKRIVDAMNDWHYRVARGEQLLAAIITANEDRGNGMSGLDEEMVRMFAACGFYTKYVRVTPVSYLSERSIDLEMYGLVVRLSDHDPIMVDISGELRPDETSQAFYFSQSQANAESDSVKSSVLEAIREALAGTPLQVWKTDGEEHKEKAKLAASAEAQRHGWHLSSGLLIRSKWEGMEPLQNFSFEEEYSLPGSGRKLSIAHNGSYQLDNAATYEQRKRTQPDCEDFGLFLRTQARAVTERKLQKNSYGEAINLIREDDEFKNDIRAELTRIIAQYGFACSSCHVLINELPERPFLEDSGRSGVIFEPRDFQLAVLTREVNLGLRGRLRLVDPNKLEPYLSPNDTTDSIVRIVAATAAETIQGFLNTIQPDQFRLSDLSIGSPLAVDVREKYQDPLGEEAEFTIHALHNSLVKKITRDVADVHGFEITEVQFNLGEDPVKRRENELIGMSGDVSVEDVLVPAQTDFQNSKVTMSFMYRILSTSKLYEPMFAKNALAYEAAKQQQEALEKQLVQYLGNLLKLSYHELFRGEFRGPMNEMFSRIFRGMAERHHGLELAIDPGAFTDDTPPQPATPAIAHLSNLIEQKQIEQNNLYMKLGNDIEDDGEKLEQIDAIDAHLKRMTAKRDDLRIRQKEVDVDAIALEALPKVTRAITAEVKALKLSPETQAAISSSLQDMQRLQAPQDTEETKNASPDDKDDRSEETET